MSKASPEQKIKAKLIEHGKRLLSFTTKGTPQEASLKKSLKLLRTKKLPAVNSALEDCIEYSKSPLEDRKLMNEYLDKALKLVKKARTKK